jgi:hypothetical protein
MKKLKYDLHCKSTFIAFGPPSFLNCPRTADDDRPLYLAFSLETFYGANYTISMQLLRWIFLEKWSRYIQDDCLSESDTVLTKISGSKTVEATEGSRYLHNEDLHNLYSSPNTHYDDDKIKRGETGESYSTSGKQEMYTEFWLEKQQQRPLGKPRR